ncbi:MAG: carbonic anhydrase, partial [Flavobacteriales bacterium]
TLTSPASKERRLELVDGQNPMAVILSCSDSRAPAELIFDQGLGDLFVIRVAGNVVAPSQVGSVEYAASALGTRLVVVMGHTHCGAVAATVDAINNPAAESTRNIASIVDRIRPAVQPLLAAGVTDRELLLRQAMHTNVSMSANHLRHGSALLENLLVDGGLRVVGAAYDIESGIVSFFDGVEGL